MSDKIEWRGRLLGVQPRIRLTRSFDERYHTYLGYVLFVRSEGEAREFSVGIGRAAQAKHAFRAGDGQSTARPTSRRVGHCQVSMLDSFAARYLAPR